MMQEGEHDPAEDARAALALFKKFRREWEASLVAKKRGKGKKKTAEGGAGGKAKAKEKKAHAAAVSSIAAVSTTVAAKPT